MKQLLIGLVAAFYALIAPNLAAGATTTTPWSDRVWQLKLGTVNIGQPYAGINGEVNCKAAAQTYAEGRGTSGNYFCHAITAARVTFTANPLPCTTQPSTNTVTIACAAGLSPPWQQTTTVTVSAAPACTVTTTLTPPAAPASACQPPVASGPAVYFSDCQTGAAAGCVAGNNANPGTLASPKQNLAGINVNTQAAGTRLLFARGGAWDFGGHVLLENPNASAATPLVFDAYGTGPLPWFRQDAGNMFQLGGNWNNTSNDGGYVFRNLKFDGMGTAEWGFWFVHTVRDVIIEDSELTGFRIAVNSNDSDTHGVTGITLRNNDIHHNRAMGMLGHYNNLLIEGNQIRANNFSGSGFDHGTYLGGGNNITIRNNHYNRNSVVNGVCQGGNMTFHGQIDGLLIEGNTIEQDAAAPGCWLMSITQGYTTAEWFRNAIVRGNRFINGGNTAMNAQSAPGILVEGNIVHNTQGGQVGLGVGNNEYEGGDVLDGDAIVRNNTGCYPTGTGNSLLRVIAPNSTVTNNVTLTGAAALTGACARP